MTEEDKLVWRRTALEFATKDTLAWEAAPDADRIVRDANKFYNFLVNGDVSGDSEKSA